MIYNAFKLLMTTIIQLIFFKWKWNSKHKAIVFKTNFRPMGYAGYTVGMLVWISDKYQKDVGLHEHELDHVDYFYEDFPLSLVKWVSKGYRLKLEVRAYKKQMKYGLPLQRAATLLSTRYPFGLSYEEARDLLSN